MERGRLLPCKHFICGNSLIPFEEQHPISDFAPTSLLQLPVLSRHEGLDTSILSAEDHLEGIMVVSAQKQVYLRRRVLLLYRM